MKGFYNQILTIDLTAGTSKIESVGEEIYKTYLGGKGLATWLLSERNPMGVDPMSPDNRIIFATGPVRRLDLGKFPLWGVYQVPLDRALFRVLFRGAGA